MRQSYGEHSRGSRWQSPIIARDETGSIDPRNAPGHIIQIILTVILFFTLAYCLYIANKTEWRKRNGQLDPARNDLYRTSCITLMIGLVFDFVCLVLGDNSPAYLILLRISAFPYLWAVLFFLGLLFHIIKQQVVLAFPTWRGENLPVLQGILFGFIVLETFLQFIEYCILPAEPVGSYYTGVIQIFTTLQPINYICVFLWLVAAIDVFSFACIFAIKKVHSRHYRLYFLGLATIFLLYAIANVATCFVIYYLEPPIIVDQAMVYICLLSRIGMYPLMIHLGPPSMIRTDGKRTVVAEEEGGGATEIPDVPQTPNARDSRSPRRHSVEDSDLDGTTIHSVTAIVS